MRTGLAPSLETAQRVPGRPGLLSREVDVGSHAGCSAWIGRGQIGRTQQLLGATQQRVMVEQGGRLGAGLGACAHDERGNVATHIGGIGCAVGRSAAFTLVPGNDQHERAALLGAGAQDDGDVGTQPGVALRHGAVVHVLGSGQSSRLPSVPASQPLYQSRVASFHLRRSAGQGLEFTSTEDLRLTEVEAISYCRMGPPDSRSMRETIDEQVVKRWVCRLRSSEHRLLRRSHR